MRELISLLKVSLNVNFGISAFKYKYFKQRKELWQPILFLVVLLAMIPAYLVFISLIKGMYKGFEMMNQEPLLLLLGFLGISVIVFLFGIMYVMSKFYFANDLSLLIPLPLKPRNIIISKFLTLVVNEYITIIPFLLPILILYGVESGMGLLYWVYSILLFLFLPIIPLALATILIMIFMKITNIKGKRDLIRIIGFILMLVIIFSIQIGLQFSVGDIPEGEEESYIAEMIQGNSKLVSEVGRSFPPSIWATKALSQANSLDGLMYLLIYTGVSLVVFYLMILLGERVFYKGLIGGQETVVKSKKLSQTDFDKKTSRANHPVISILMRELRLLIRTPIFLMNSIGAVILMPIVMLIPLIKAEGWMTSITQYYNDQNILMINLALVGFLIFLGAANGVASTTYSREGKQFWISRILPVEVEHQNLGKLLSGLSIQLLGVIAILISVSFIVRLKLSTILVVSLLGLLASTPVMILSMLIDIMRPLLDWDNPQKAMKQNLNVLFAMMVGLLTLLVYGLLVLLMQLLNSGAIITYLMLGLFIIIASIMLFKLLNSVTNRRFREIE